MVVFLRIVAQLGAAAARWAWANKERVLELILQGFGIQYIIDYINARA
ncbi:aureocin A53 family class IId bacteriocin [Oceanobacillus chungangensis]|uniref:Bacteriocin aureocin A53 n=1 Tax=Oceanobacillus chungangensis TaxID=1229152 RepID=A0A3D8PJD9_9BACI|nr:aureocin A53 family class IId bacteriocin [Oceanobacillus chungangensis]RDW16164.1 bacteriocin aureocin A53 [Oceanobacillus chungangensis]